MTEPQERENLWAHAKRLRFVQETIEQVFPGRAPASVHVLDVGCGNGSQLAVPLLRLGYQITGVDPHSRSIERAKEMTAGMTHARFVCGHVEALTGPPFDVMILSEVLEHVTEPRQLLEESLRYLSKSGVVIVTVPNGYGEFEIDSWFFRTLRLQRVLEWKVAIGRWLRGRGEASGNEAETLACTENCDCTHVQFFTRRRLRRLFRDCSLIAFREGAASLWSGPLVSSTLGLSARFVEWNARIVDRLPLALASGWYFALRRCSEPTAALPDERSTEAQFDSCLHRESAQ